MQDTTSVSKSFVNYAIPVDIQGEANDNTTRSLFGCCFNFYGNVHNVGVYEY